jgi:hypothetical protein
VNTQQGGRFRSVAAGPAQGLQEVFLLDLLHGTVQEVDFSIPLCAIRQGVGLYLVDTLGKMLGQDRGAWAECQMKIGARCPRLLQ